MSMLADGQACFEGDLNEHEAVAGGESTIISDLPGDLVRHFLESFATEARVTLHVTVLAGVNAHHKAEASFKALAKAMRDAVELDQRAVQQVPSTKGTISS